MARTNSPSPTPSPTGPTPGPTPGPAPGSTTGPGTGPTPPAGDPFAGSTVTGGTGSGMHPGAMTGVARHLDDVGNSLTTTGRSLGGHRASPSDYGVIGGSFAAPLNTTIGQSADATTAGGRGANGAARNVRDSLEHLRSVDDGIATNLGSIQPPTPPPPPPGTTNGAPPHQDHGGTQVAPPPQVPTNAPPPPPPPPPPSGGNTVQSPPPVHGTPPPPPPPPPPGSGNTVQSPPPVHGAPDAPPPPPPPPGTTNTSGVPVPPPPPGTTTTSGVPGGSTNTSGAHGAPPPPPPGFGAPGPNQGPPPPPGRPPLGGPPGRPPAGPPRPRPPLPTAPLSTPPNATPMPHDDSRPLGDRVNDIRTQLGLTQPVGTVVVPTGNGPDGRPYRLDSPVSDLPPANRHGLTPGQEGMTIGELMGVPPEVMRDDPEFAQSPARDTLDQNGGGGYGSANRVLMLDDRHNDNATLFHELGHARQHEEGFTGQNSQVTLLEFHNVLTNENAFHGANGNNPRLDYVPVQGERPATTWDGLRTWLEGDGRPVNGIRPLDEAHRQQSLALYSQIEQLTGPGGRYAADGDRIRENLIKELFREVAVVHRVEGATHYADPAVGHGK
ncbi:hypothetical protein [Actinosynnema sp. NPDC020468]|uniref:hypothetical protein n=1 Tax=Actinosynnema sp. NPDC020468 TaxID=3154488 RepID=UPI0033D7E3A6